MDGKLSKFLNVFFYSQKLKKKKKILITKKLIQNKKEKTKETHMYYFDINSLFFTLFSFQVKFAVLL